MKRTGIDSPPSNKMMTNTLTPTINRVAQSYAILDHLRLENGMYLAAGSSDYHYVWLRDSFYEVRPYLDKDAEKYTKTYHTILDMLKKYRWKIEYHTRVRPVAMFEYIHARWDADNLTEIDAEWGHAQHDAVGAILFGIAEGVEAGMAIIRDESDLEIIRLTVEYLACSEYWHDADNGMWEENREVHASSVGAVVAALKKLRDLGIVYVKPEWIANGEAALESLLPWESPSKPADLALLSLIYPYNVVDADMAKEIVSRVEALLLRSRGVLRYETDSYFSLVEDRGLPAHYHRGSEAEWTFGLPWLSLAHMTLGDMDKAEMYIKWTESVMLDNGALPELYYAHSSEYGTNSPLGWSSAMHIMAAERYDALTNE